ncbi:MAG TPA: hypothetical protein VNU19_19240 [Candidatus Acidoferrum sp.]|nr:hypothetical protein [Candidatus Acidoferrum sp.]
MRRLLCCIGLAAILLLHSAIALAAPTPSPGLDGILIKPPGTTFKEAPKAAPGIVEGPFDAATFAELTSAPDAAATARMLAQNGFVSGFGRTWASPGNAHVFVEAVMVFAGAKGATAWLRLSETADKADPTYSQALTVAGIDTYYGARLIDKVHKIYGDEFVFAKGNDILLVTYVSSKNDLGTVAATQAKKQFDAAPPYTIPPDQWPESKVVTTSPFAGLKTIGLVIGVLILLGLIGAGGFIFWSRRRPALQAIPAQDPPGFVSGSSITVPQSAATPPAIAVPMAVAGAAAVAPPITEGPFVMSEDRVWWWDGAAWRNADNEVPPAAQRSEDSNFWWDGEAWRPMPPSLFAG